jgi:hypothetical protein
VLEGHSSGTEDMLISFAFQVLLEDPFGERVRSNQHRSASQNSLAGRCCILVRHDERIRPPLSRARLAPSPTLGAIERTSKHHILDKEQEYLLTCPYVRVFPAERTDSDGARIPLGASTGHAADSFKPLARGPPALRPCEVDFQGAGRPGPVSRGPSEPALLVMIRNVIVSVPCAAPDANRPWDPSSSRDAGRSSQGNRP